MFARLFSRPRGWRLYALIGAPLACLIVVAAVAAVNALRRPVTDISRTVNGGQDLSLKLSDGASLSIASGGVQAGTNVRFRSVAATQAPSTPGGDYVLGQVYEIDAPGWTEGMTSTVTLPIAAAGSDQADLATYEVAYYELGDWIAVPSSVDIVAKTVSGVLPHFSMVATVHERFRSILRPQVTVTVNPRAYTGITLEHMNPLQLPEDLIVDVYASDNDMRSDTIYTTVGLFSPGGWAPESKTTLQQETTNRMALEAAAVDVIGGEASLASDAVGAFTDQPANPCGEKSACLKWLRVETPSLPAASAGEQHFTYRIDLGNVHIDSPLRELRVFVRFYRAGNPLIREVVAKIPVVAEDVPGTPDLVAPGAGSEMVCPPQPTFRWDFGHADVAHVGKYALFLARGGDPWTQKVRWACTVDPTGAQPSGCNADGPTQAWGDNWTPAEPLNEGAYAWGFASSMNTTETQWKLSDPAIGRSDVYRFLVDNDVEGHDCLPMSQQAPFKPVTPGGGIGAGCTESSLLDLLQASDVRMSAEYIVGSRPDLLAVDNTLWNALIDQREQNIQEIDRSDPPLCVQRLVKLEKQYYQLEMQRWNFMKNLTPQEQRDWNKRTGEVTTQVDGMLAAEARLKVQYSEEHDRLLSLLPSASSASAAATAEASRQLTPEQEANEGAHKYLVSSWRTQGSCPPYANLSGQAATAEFTFSYESPPASVVVTVNGLPGVKGPENAIYPGLKRVGTNQYTSVVSGGEGATVVLRGSGFELTTIQNTDWGRCELYVSYRLVK